MKTTTATECTYAQVPMKNVGPVRISGPEVQGDFELPLATFETPLWPSVARGARLSQHCGGVQAVVVSDVMARSVIVEAPDAAEAVRVARELELRQDELADVATQGSRFTRWRSLHHQIAGRLLFLRMEMETGDASGHNMVTAAADRVLTWLLATYPSMSYVSISGNYCTDKKVSAVNGILGRGKYVIAELTVPEMLCRKFLKTTPRKLEELNTRKNLLGSILSGGVRSANAHAANMLLAFYLATGQDAANIVEGSQSITLAEERGGDLYFSVTLPNLILGAVGNGKHLDFARDNLEQLGCLEPREPGQNGRRLAVFAAAAVLCGELSLLAAQTNPGELMAAHIKYERS